MEMVNDFPLSLLLHSFISNELSGKQKHAASAHDLKTVSLLLLKSSLF